jgi:predicted ArsR family transcriptional regulator
MPKSAKQAIIAKVLGESRWRILSELCRKSQTASELAARVTTSANAVRVHLDALQEAGLVEYNVERRQVGKPTHVYTLTDAAEALLSKAYVPALDAVLAAAREQGAEPRKALLKKAGIALATKVAEGPSQPGGIPAARRILDTLGAITTLEQRDGRGVLEASCCPLGALTRESADPCVMVESALRFASGMDIRHGCARGSRSRCRFEFTI